MDDVRPQDGPTEVIGAITAVCVVAQKIPTPHAQYPESAIDKRPVDGPCLATEDGLAGDTRVDRENHGQLDSALYAYAEEDAAWWEAELQAPVLPGQFGENLRTRGLNLNAARAGDIWQIGESLRVQVTRPRIPCATFAQWMGIQGWVKKFVAAQRPGTYLQVLRPGEIAAGDVIRKVQSNDESGLAILDQFLLHYRR